MEAKNVFTPRLYGKIEKRIKNRNQGKKQSNTGCFFIGIYGNRAVLPKNSTYFEFGVKSKSKICCRERNLKRS